MDSLSIKIDSREDNSKIGEVLAREYGISVTREVLRIGDYIIDDKIVIERKTAIDFIQSVIDGRLFKQAAKMKQFFDFASFVVEGDGLYNTGINIHPHAVKGALISLALAWHMQVFFYRECKRNRIILILNR